MWQRDSKTHVMVQPSLVHLVKSGKATGTAVIEGGDDIILLSSLTLIEIIFIMLSLFYGSFLCVVSSNKKRTYPLYEKLLDILTFR
jgi:hypothetical protein